MTVPTQRDIREMRILTLSDQPLDAEIMNAILSENGFKNYQGLSDPLEIIEALNDSDNLIDLLLLDLSMSEKESLSILEVLDIQFEQLDKPAVIMLTSEENRAFRVKLLEAGASDYITKPFDPIELIKRMEIQLKNRALTKQLQEQNTSLEELVQKRTAQMTEVYQEVLARLGKASEYRYHETGNRIKRVSLFSELMALDLGLDPSYAEQLRVATLMHDVGKIGVSDKIMLKPDQLTFEEFEIMKSHVKIGAEILQGHSSEFLQLAHDIALTHHEKFDGSGYPNNLIGEKIPLCGRIVAIADVFDALTSARAYKKARPVDYAVDLIKSESGKHFDPKVVDSFLRVLPDVLVIKEKYADTLKN